ncbi:MAG: FecR domain-containing protein [Myxococcota bacterium]
MSFAPEHLPERIGDVLESDVDEERAHRLWQGTRKRMTRRSRAPQAAALALTAAVAFLFWPQGPAPLRFADGSAVAAVQPSERASIAFDDESTVVLTAGTSLTPVANRADYFEAVVGEGRIVVDIVPGGPRRWVFRAGEARVEVLGTQFTIAHDAASVIVSVSRGRVRVRHPSIDTQILEAGDEVRIESEQPAADEVEDPAPEAVVEPLEPAVGSAPQPRRVSWRALAERGEHAEAYRALGREGVATRSQRASARELMLLADVARLSGHPSAAVAPLERLLRDHSEQPEAALAAVILGRLQLEQLGQPAAGRRSLERALELGLPRVLRADVERRLAETQPE